LRRRDLPGGVAPLIFATAEGKVVGPIKVDKGYALYYVQKRYAAELNETNREKIRTKLFETWLRRETKRSEISFPLLETLSEADAAESPET
jgi:parvulin-like peptidyl-prolyl isomerase